MRRATLLIAAAVLLTATSAAALCTVEPDSLNFSSCYVDIPKTMSFTVTNTGDETVTGHMDATGSYSSHMKFDGNASTYGYTLAPGESAVVNVTFDAPWSGGFFPVIDLGAVGGEGGPSVVYTHAYGMMQVQSGDPRCSVSPSIKMEFPPMVVGSEAVDQLTIHNWGGDNPTQGAGYLYGELPTVAGEFTIPWGGEPFGVTGTQRWDVYWRPTTPGKQVIHVELPDLCQEHVLFELHGLALFDGPACELSVDVVDFGLVSVGEVGYGSLTIQNMGSEVLTPFVPQECGPFTIPNGFGYRSLGPAQLINIPIEFRPTETGIQTCTLDFLDPTVGTVELSGVGLSDPGTPDRIGIWFEQTGSTNELDTTTPFEEVTAYLMIQNPSTQWGVSGWECCVEMTGDGVGLSWDLAGTPLNVETPPCFSVGMQSGALLGGPSIVLATLTFLQPDPEAPTFFFVHPVTDPSLPDVAVYADGLDPGNLIALSPASGSETIPVAMVNAPPTAADDLPTRTVLTKAQPNPFNPSTTLFFETAREGAARLSIHDLRGRRVRTLVDGMMPGGAHQQVWDGRDEAGRTVESGVYFARLEAGGERRMLKVMLLK